MAGQNPWDAPASAPQVSAGNPWDEPQGEPKGEPEESRGAWGYVKDTGRGLIGGVVDAVVETAIAAKDFVGYAAEQSARRELERDRVMDKVAGLRDTQAQVSKANAEKRALLNESIRDEKRVFKQTAGVEAETGLGKTVNALTQFLVPFTKLNRVVGAQSIVAKVGTSAVVASTAFDPYEESVSNLLSGTLRAEHPQVAAAIDEYLAVQGDDSEAEARAKKLVEDVALGMGAEGAIKLGGAVLRGLRAVKLNRRAKVQATEQTLEDRIMADAVGIDEVSAEAAKEEAAFEAGFKESAEAEIDANVAQTFRDYDPADTVRNSTSKIDGGKWTVVESKSGSGGTIYLTEAGRSKAYLQYAEGGIDQGAPTWQLRSVHIDPDWRSQGYSTEMYDRLIRRAAQRGALVVSDVNVSEKAANTWASLERRGYGVLKNETSYLENGRWLTHDGEPVFRVTSLAERPINTGGTRAPGTFTATALRNPRAARLVASVIANGRGGVLGKTVRSLLKGDVDEVAEGGSKYNEGRIDWKSFGNAEGEAKDLLRAAEAAVKDIAAEAGIDEVPWEQSNALAARLKDTFGVSVVGDAFEATGNLHAKIVASHAVLMDAQKYVADLARAVKAGTAAQADLIAGVEMYRAVHAQVRGASAEVGRALAVHRQLRAASDAGSQQFADLARELGYDPEAKKLVEALVETSRPSALNRELMKTKWERTKDAAMEVFYNGILSSPRTWVVNTFSSAANIVMQIPERAVASTLGELRKAAAEALGNKRWATDGAMFVELKGQLVGLNAGLRSAFKAVYAPLRLKTFDMKAMSEAYNAELHKVWGDVVPPSQVDASKRQAIRVEVPADASTAEAFWSRGINALGAVIRVPTAIIKKTDDFVRIVAFEQERYALAYREIELVNRNPRMADFYEQSIGRKVTPEDILLSPKNKNGHTQLEADAFAHAEDAAQFASEMVFQQKGGQFVRWLQNGQARFPELRYVLPFVKTPANLFRWGFLERTPLGILSRDVRAQWADPGRVGDIARARLLVGTSIAVGAFAMASERDAEGRPVWFTGARRKGLNSEDFDGIPPYSVRVPGTDRWVSYQRLDPFGLVLGLTADIVEIGEQLDDPDSPALLDASRALVFALAKNSMSKTWLSGISTFISAMEDPDRYGDQFLTQLVGGFVPFSSLSRTAVTAGDEYAREAFGLVEKLRAQLPGRQELAIKRDYLGRPVTARNKLGPDFLSPVDVVRESNDPVDRELSRLRFGYSMPDKKLGGVPLTSNEYSRLLEIRGTERDPATGLTLHEALTALVAREDYTKLPDDVQVDVLKRLVNGYSRGAGEQFRAEQAASGGEWLQRKQKLDEVLDTTRKQQVDGRDGVAMRHLLGLPPAA